MLVALYIGCFHEFPERNFAPTLFIEEPAESYRSTEGDVYNDGTPIPFTFFIEDFDSNPQDIDVQLQSNLDGVIFEGMPDGEGRVSILDSSLQPGTHQITIVVADKENVISSEFPLVINGRPSVPELQILPENPTTSDDLIADIISVYDPEGQSVELDIVWLLSGEEQDETETTLSYRETSKGQRWSVRVTPIDEYGRGETATASVLIADSPPVVESIEVVAVQEDGSTQAVQSAYNDQQLQCSAQLYDPDEEDFSIQYSWILYEDDWYVLDTGNNVCLKSLCEI